MNLGNKKKGFFQPSKDNLKVELLGRKSNFISELRSLRSAFKGDDKSASNISKLIDIISNAPNELFLDKIFFKNALNVNNSENTNDNLHFSTLKKIHKVFLNKTLLTDEQRVLISYIERAFMKLKLKGVSSSS